MFKAKVSFDKEYERHSNKDIILRKIFRNYAVRILEAVNETMSDLQNLDVAQINDIWQIN